MSNRSFLSPVWGGCLRWSFLLLFLLLSVVSAQDQNPSNPNQDPRGSGDKSLEGSVNAPDFPSGLEWLNTDGALSLRELRGKIVLVDFWTYCCVNCMHII